LYWSICVCTQLLPHWTKPWAQVAAHWPPEQTGVAPLQMRPQTPQLFGSYSSTVQTPSQAVCWMPQLAQTPLAQTWLNGQMWPHVPQLSTSLARFSQKPLQLDSPAAQQMPVVLPVGMAQLPLAQLPLAVQAPPAATPEQTPAVQVPPVPQTLPHPPQFAASVCVFTHAVPQSVEVGAVQVMPHVPDVQVGVPVPAVGPGQTVPQAPQLVALVVVSVQVPAQFVLAPGAAGQQIDGPPGVLDAAQLPLAHCDGAVQIEPFASFVQAPAVHVAPAGQTLPQAPQLLVLVVWSTHVPPQFSWPVGQQMLPVGPVPVFGVHVSPVMQVAPGLHGEPVGTLPQTPPAQVELAGQTLPQLPQLLLSVAVFTHAVPHSVPVGAVHVMPQTGGVPEHVVVPVPAVGPGHGVHDVPQLLTEVLETHVPEQLCWPAGQLRPQTPPVQLAVPPSGGQTWPQAPQLLTSLLSVEQTPPQSTVPCGQEPVPQTPL
jgi:hypothetical protein